METPQEYQDRIRKQTDEQFEYHNELRRIASTYKELEQRVAALEKKEAR